jgi:hypothetical protein
MAQQTLCNLDGSRIVSVVSIQRGQLLQSAHILLVQFFPLSHDPLVVKAR